MIELEELVAVFRVPRRNGTSARDRDAARRLLATAPTATATAETRAAWWELVETLTRDRFERPEGCANGHHKSELRWNPDKRPTSRRGGFWYCLECRREARRAKRKDAR